MKSLTTSLAIARSPKVSALINALMMILRTGAPTPQTRAGGSLAALLSLLRARPPSDSGHPNDKVVAKLCSLAAAAAVATAVQPAEPTADEPAAAPDTAAKAAAAADEALAARKGGQGRRRVWTLAPRAHPPSPPGGTRRASGGGRADRSEQLLRPVRGRALVVDY